MNIHKMNFSLLDTTSIEEGLQTVDAYIFLAYGGTKGIIKSEPTIFAQGYLPPIL
jgi:hypothetical protein